MSMATRSFGLTAEEAPAAVTRHAARAAGLHLKSGIPKEGYATDFVIWDVRSLDELSYWVGFNRCRTVVKADEVVHGQTLSAMPITRSRQRRGVI
jgi:imidazolonepropionase